jgi:cyclopropane-fatty-acyl-phospholipid synthase
MALRAHQPERSEQKTLAFLQELLRGYHPRNFSIELWDGAVWQPEPGQFHRFAWKIKRPGAVRAAFASASELGLAEAYIYGDFDIEGDIEGVFPLADYLLSDPWSKKQKLRLGAMLLTLPSGPIVSPVRPQASLRGRVHSKERDRQAVSYHYDVSNDFYGLWLGDEMAYSCAYFRTPEDDLDTAQRQKFDHICRKLRLRPGERLLDIGCGWGGFILHAAREYGANALGITLSQEQLILARRRIEQQGLSNRCEVRLLDYRDLEDHAGYDKIASIGMVEHVGEANLPEYFRRVFHLLRPGGVFLNHGISVPEARSHSQEPGFADLYVFPDGELVPLSTLSRTAELAGFEVRDVENLREHYALTLRHWVRGIQENAEQARRLVDDVTFRIWRLHMAGSAHYFQSRKLELYQSLLLKNENGQSDLPLTRADWYSPPALFGNEPETED